MGGVGKGAMAPLSLLKLVIKKMAAIGCPLYFMFVAPPPRPAPDHAGSDAVGNILNLSLSCSSYNIRDRRYQLYNMSREISWSEVYLILHR